MSNSYNFGYNKDDVVIRSLIVGLLADLNNKLFIRRRINNESKKFSIPFYFSLANSQNFMYDHFMYSDGNLQHFICDPECSDKELAQGHYEETPRGVLTLNGISVDSQALSNRYIRGFYSKLEGECVKEYSAEIHMIPIILNIGVQIVTDNLTDNLKITESIIKQLYKLHLFSVETGDIDDAIYRLDGKYSIPEEFGNTFQYEYGFDDREDPMIEFEIELKSFIPSIDYDTEMFSSTRMETIYGNKGLGSQFSYGGTNETESIFQQTGIGPFDPKNGRVIVQDFSEYRFRRL